MKSRSLSPDPSVQNDLLRTLLSNESAAEFLMDGHNSSKRMCYKNAIRLTLRALVGKWYIFDTRESQHQHYSPKLSASTTQNSGAAQKSSQQWFETPRSVGSVARSKHVYKRVTFSISGNYSSCYSILESTLNTTPGVRNVALESDRRAVECDIDLSITSIHDVTSSVQDASRHIILHGYYECEYLKLDPPTNRETAENLLMATFLKA
ncbi:hypothetical protein KCU67_g91, partial [Aureobasidium melanogenum]